MYFLFVDSGKDAGGAKHQKRLVWVAIFPVTINMTTQQINHQIPSLRTLRTDLVIGQSDNSKLQVKLRLT